MGLSTLNKIVLLLRNMLEDLIGVYQVYCCEFIETEICY